MHVATRVLIVVGCLLLIPVTAVLTAAAKQRLSDGLGLRVFGRPPRGRASCTPARSRTGASPTTIATIELQLEDPARSRTIWVGEHDGKLYVFSALHAQHGRPAVEELAAPGRARRPGGAAHRRQRYERQLRRIESGPMLEAITASIADKYTYDISRELVQAGDIWLFEAAPRAPSP